MSPRSQPGRETLPVEEDRWQTARMHFAVNLHLKRFEEALEWGIKFLKSLWCNSYTIFALRTDLEIEGKDELLLVTKEMLRLVTVEKEGNLFPFILPRLYSFINEINMENKKDHNMEGNRQGGNVKSTKWIESSCCELLSNIRVNYGAHCIKKLQVNT